MKRIFLTGLALLLIVAGLTLFALGIRGFLRTVSPGGEVFAAEGGVMVSPGKVGLYAPPSLWIGAVTAALGIILFTFRKHY